MILDARYEFGDKLPVHWKFPVRVDLSEAQAALAQFLEKTPFTETNQINLTSRYQENQDPYQETGSIYSREENKSVTKESEYKYFIKKFEGTYFHKLFSEVAEKSVLPIGRVRFLKLKAKACYSVHRDNSIRYHIALHTNPECYLVFKNQGLIHIPADGQCYATNTLLEHSAMNGSLEERIHLVFSTAWTPDAPSLLAQQLNAMNIPIQY